MSACTLFLDFDGVTHQINCHSSKLFSRLPLIEAVLRDFPAVQVVLSSSWRQTRSLDQMRSVFSADMRQRIVDAAPLLQLQRETPQRELECMTWLRHHRPVGAFWMALDDEAQLWRPGCPHLLVTDAATGFTEEDAAQLDSMLRVFEEEARMLDEIKHLHFREDE